MAKACLAAPALSCSQAFRASSYRPARSQRAAVSIRCAKQDDAAPAKQQLAAASLAAALLIAASPVNAGVILEKAPAKKVFIGSDAPPAKKSEISSSSSSGLPSLPSLSAPSVPSVGFNLNPRSVALPGAVVGIGAIAVLLTKVDTGFSDFFSSSIVRDSTKYAGYEESIRETYAQPVNAIKKGASKATKAASRTAKKAKQAGTKRIFGFGKN